MTKPSIRQRLSWLHLKIGEKLGLTKYRNCWDCEHCHDIDYDTKFMMLCDLEYEQEGVYAITDPSEAVWCLDGFEERHDR